MNRIGEFRNIPEVKLGIIAVSRDCFPRTLSEMRHANIVKASGVYEGPVTGENEGDMLKAVADVKAAGCNAIVVFLSNFGPETPETLITKYFDDPCMFVAAANGALLPPCSDRKALSAPRRGGLWPLRQGAVRGVQILRYS